MNPAKPQSQRYSTFSPTTRWRVSSNSVALSARAGRSNPRGAGDGFLWPDLTIAAAGDMTRLEWHRDRSAQGDDEARYVSAGTKLVDTVWVRDSLVDSVEAVLSRLSEPGIKETPLHDEWAGLLALDSDEQEFCAACGRLGIDPFSEGHDLGLAGALPGLNARLRISGLTDEALPELHRLQEQMRGAQRSRPEGSTTPPPP